jgi:DNA-directed RNA polymerase specialized sigma24 family protein
VPGRGLRRLGVLDPLETVALVARERRELLLARYGHRLGREELEDCYSQVTLELLARARRPEPFDCCEHIANALEQRLRSRIRDRHRALGGRSPMQAALARAVPLPGGEEPAQWSRRGLVDGLADVERIALLREELRRIARFSRELTRDQRLLLASQLHGRQAPGEFCLEHGWSLEKYRKVGQRARARLTALLAADSAAPAADADAPQIASATVPVAAAAMSIADAARPTGHAATPIADLASPAADAVAPPIAGAAVPVAVGRSDQYVRTRL